MKRKHAWILLFAAVSLCACGQQEKMQKAEGVRLEAAKEMQTKMTEKEKEMTQKMKQEAAAREAAEKAAAEKAAAEKAAAEKAAAEKAAAEKAAAEKAAAAQGDFYYTALTDEIKARITGISYPDTAEPLQISYQELAYVHVLHYDFNGNVKEGELVCNQAIARDLTEIFQELYRWKYPIEKIRLVDEYGGNDERSMEDNNTSCFNYRVISGTTRLSNHSYGTAIDINPLYNPYVVTRSDGTTSIQPANGTAYADRNAEFSYKIDHEDLCYRLFTQHGFTWGGDWKNTKDYQHFEKKY